MILANRRITVDELANSLEITQDIKSFMMTLGAGKFLQGGCQESLRRTTSKKRLRICQLFLNAAKKTIQTTGPLGFEVLQHSNYPDLVPSNYHLFGLLKDVCEQECGSGSWKRKRWKRSFSVEAEARKIPPLPLPHRGKNGKRKEIGSAILRRRTNRGA